MSIEMATCQTCNRSFTRKSVEQWKRLCLACWKASRGHKQAAIHALTQHCKKLEHDLQVLRGQPRASNPPAHVLKFLMKVAHPDQHANAPEANEALRWLLDFHQFSRIRGN